MGTVSPAILPARAPFPTFLISFAAMVVLATALPIPHLVPFAPSGWLEANSVDGGGNRVDRVRESVSVAALALIVGITPGRLVGWSVGRLVGWSVGRSDDAVLRRRHYGVVRAKGPARRKH